MTFKLKSVALLSSVVSIAIANPTFAGDPALYKILRDNKVITQAQFEELLKSKSSEVKVTNKGSLKFKSDTGDFQYKIGGRIMADAAYYDEDKSNLASGTEFRRARLFVSGRMYENWIWKAQFDWAGNSTTLKDMYLGYDFDPLVLRIGRFGEAGGLEDTNSSKYITFMERNLPTLAFAPATRRMGIAINSSGDNWSYQVGVHGEEESSSAGGGGENESTGGSARFTFAPMHEKTSALHLGASMQYREPKGDSVRFRARPEAHVDNTRFVNTGTLNDVENYITSGLEFAWVGGPFSLQSEYLRVDVKRDNNLSDLDFDGYSVFGSWFITGESRPYDVSSGSFGRVKPKSFVTSGGTGAWELGLRFSNLDLNDGAVLGGEQDNITLGLNWYVNPKIRFMFNYVSVDTDNYAGNDDPDIYQIRAQIDF